MQALNFTSCSLSHLSSCVQRAGTVWTGSVIKPLPSPVAMHSILSTQLVHSFGPHGTTAVSHYFLSSCVSQC